MLGCGEVDGEDPYANRPLARRGNTKEEASSSSVGRSQEEVREARREGTEQASQGVIVYRGVGVRFLFPFGLRGQGDIHREGRSRYGSGKCGQLFNRPLAGA